MHAVDAILDAFKTRIGTSTPAGTDVYRGRIDPYETDVRQAVGIYQGSDDPIPAESGRPPSNNQFLDSILEVTVDLVVKDFGQGRSAGQDLDSLLLDLRLAVYKQIMADDTLGGLSWANGAGVIQVFPQGTDEPDRSQDSERPFITQPLLFDVHYRTDFRDPEV